MNNTILTLNSFATMAPIDEAIAFLKSSNKPNISEAARIFQVEESVLSKRFRGTRASIAKANETKQLLINKQDLVLANVLFV
jgi:hypothetical protein